MLFLLLASIFACTLLMCHVHQRISICKAVILGTTNYFFLYVLISACLIWLDIFSVLRTVIAALIFSAAGVFYLLFIKKRKKAEIYFDRKELIISLSVLFLVFLVSGEKFGFFGMGQDQGVYQTKAIEFIYDHNENQYDFDEYELLKNSGYTEETANYKKILEIYMGGFYLCSNHRIASMANRSESDVDGIYHGIPTFPALLALSGKLFGVSHMMDIQTLFFFLFLMGVFYILENFRIHTLMEILSIAILLFSSEVIWVSKSALTEMFICVITCTFVRLLTEHEEKLQHCSIIPVLVFSFYHVTIFTMMPMLVVLYFIKAFWDKNQSFIRDTAFIVCGYLCGYEFMAYIEPQYTIDNYVKSLGEYLPFITSDTLSIFIFAVCICALAVCLMTYIAIKSNWFKRAGKLVYNHWLLFYKIFLALCLLGIGLRAFLIFKRLNGVGNIGLVAFSIATGIALLPMALIRLLTIKKSDKIINVNSCIVWVFFLYAIVVYSLLFKTNIEYFYYYGRYIIPYLFIVIVSFCTLYNHFSCHKLIYLAYLGGVLAFAQSDMVLMTQPDDTKVSMNVLEDVLNVLNNVDSENGKTAVVVSHDLVTTFGFPIKSCGNDLYFEWESSGQEIFLRENYDTIFYITNNSDLDTNDDNYTIIYRNINNSSEDDLQNAHPLTQYPTKFVESQSTISIYQMNPYRYSYNVTDSDSFSGTGFYFVEDDSFAWTNGSAEITCYLSKNDYSVSLQFNAYLPMDDLEIDHYDIDVYANGIFVTTLTIEKGSDTDALSFELPGDVLNDGNNILSFQSTPWCPADYGSSDTRGLGFAFQSLVFEIIDE